MLQILTQSVGGHPHLVFEYQSIIHGSFSLLIFSPE